MTQNNEVYDHQGKLKLKIDSCQKKIALHTKISAVSLIVTLAFYFLPDVIHFTSKNIISICLTALLLGMIFLATSSSLLIINFYKKDALETELDDLKTTHTRNF